MKPPRRRSFLRFLGVLGPAALLASLPLPAIAHASSDPATPKPEVSLKVTPRHGYLPLDVQLTGNVAGLKSGDVESCEIVIEFVREEALGMPMNTKSSVPCTSTPAADALPGTFEKKLKAELPGTYTYRILVKPKGARVIGSTAHDVRVVRSPRQLTLTSDGGSGPVQ